MVPFDARMSVFLSMVEEIQRTTRGALQIASRWAIFAIRYAGLVCARQGTGALGRVFPKRVRLVWDVLLNVSGVRCSSLRKRAIRETWSRHLSAALASSTANKRVTPCGIHKLCAVARRRLSGRCNTTRSDEGHSSGASRRESRVDVLQSERLDCGRTHLDQRSR